MLSRVPNSMPTVAQAALLSIFGWIIALPTFFIWKFSDVIVTSGDDIERDGFDVGRWLWLIPTVGGVILVVSVYRLARQGVKSGVVDAKASPLLVALCCLLGSASVWVFDYVQTEGVFNRQESGVAILGSLVATYLTTWAGLSIRRGGRRDAKAM
jgi:hypothetical protein